MVEILEPGVSAFRGKNRAGKLGDFIDAVKNNAIPSDSWLYCENPDRLSRDQVDEALRLFLELIGLGLTIVTGMDRKDYNSKLKSFEEESGVKYKYNVKSGLSYKDTVGLRLQINRVDSELNLRVADIDYYWLQERGSMCKPAYTVLDRH